MKKYNNRKKRKIGQEKRHLLREKKKNKYKQNLKRKQIKSTMKYKISILPRDLQSKICIWTWRLYWRSYIPLTAKVPSWQKPATIIQNMLWQARERNIHFLHLPFNTLPESKTWIMGCQCDFCTTNTDIDIIEKHCHSLIQHRSPSYFTDKVMPYETIGHWNEKYILCGNLELQPLQQPVSSGSLIKIFDPLCGSYKENKMTKRLREGYPIKFNHL